MLRVADVGNGVSCCVECGGEGGRGEGTAAGLDG